MIRRPSASVFRRSSSALTARPPGQADDSCSSGSSGGAQLQSTTESMSDATLFTTLSDSQNISNEDVPMIERSRESSVMSTPGRRSLSVHKSGVWMSSVKRPRTSFAQRLASQPPTEPLISRTVDDRSFQSPLRRASLSTVPSSAFQSHSRDNNNTTTNNNNHHHPSRHIQRRLSTIKKPTTIRVSDVVKLSFHKDSGVTREQKVDNNDDDDDTIDDGNSSREDRMKWRKRLDFVVSTDGGSMEDSVSVSGQTAVSSNWDSQSVRSTDSGTSYQSGSTGPTITRSVQNSALGSSSSSTSGRIRRSQSVRTSAGPPTRRLSRTSDIRRLMKHSSRLVSESAQRFAQSGQPLLNERTMRDERLKKELRDAQLQSAEERIRIDELSIERDYLRQTLDKLSVMIQNYQNQHSDQHDINELSNQLLGITETGDGANNDENSHSSSNSKSIIIMNDHISHIDDRVQV